MGSILLVPGMSGSFAYTSPPIEVISASACTPLSVTLKVPLNAGGCLPQPSADTTPLAPCGTFALASLRWTDDAASTLVLAAASCWAGDCCDWPDEAPCGSLEQDATVTTQSPERTAAASFPVMRMGVRLTEGAAPFGRARRCGYG